MNYDSLLVLGLEVVGSGYDWLRSIYIWHEKELSWDNMQRETTELPRLKLFPDSVLFNFLGLLQESFSSSNNHLAKRHFFISISLATNIGHPYHTSRDGRSNKTSSRTCTYAHLDLLHR